MLLFCSMYSSCVKMLSSYNCWIKRSCCKFFIRRSTLFVGENTVEGWWCWGLRFSWVEGLITFTKATAALVTASVKVSFLGRLGGGPNIGSAGGVSWLSCVPQWIVLAHSLRWGTLYVSPCFSVRILKCSSTSSSSNLDDVPPLLSFLSPQLFCHSESQHHTTGIYLLISYLHTCHQDLQQWLTSTC